MGFVESLAQPGGNITGSTGIAYDLAGKRLELLKELVPQAARVAILVDPAGRDAAQAHVKGTEVAAHKLKMQSGLLDARVPEDLDNAFRAARQGRPDVLSVVAIGWVNSHRRRIVDLAAKERLPAIYSNESFVDDGGLISYSADHIDQYRRTAAYVDRILKGAKPATLPIEQPTKFELVINMKTARALRIKVPQSLLLQATRVIE
jgi:putative ABC transport system substrate-binding protein